MKIITKYTYTVVTTTIYYYFVGIFIIEISQQVGIDQI